MLATFSSIFGCWRRFFSSLPHCLSTLLFQFLKRRINKVMNRYSYSSIYGDFHRCSVSFARNNVIGFNLAHSAYKPYLLSRAHPYDMIKIDSKKPLLWALKAHFKSDEIASVIVNTKYLFTIVLGNEHVIYPVHREADADSQLNLYATTYFVKDPKLVSQYMQNSIKPAYENVFFYKNTVLFLDCVDLPSPGSCYFDEASETTLYRILFLTRESLEYVLTLMADWPIRNGVLDLAYASREAEAVVPRFIRFQPVSNPIYSDSNMLTTGLVHRKLSHLQPWLLIQDILLSYYDRASRTGGQQHLGLVIEWPFRLGYVGSRGPEPSFHEPQFVALTINQNKPTRVLQVQRPYDRFVEYSYVPPIPWTPIYFVLSTFLTQLAGAKKVALDGVVVGLAYRDAFFCFDKPLLEGRPATCPTVNTHYLLSTLSFDDDPHVRVLDRYKHNDQYALLRVKLDDVTTECWCLKPSQEHFPKLPRTPHLVQQWLDFFREVKDNAFSVDVSIIRLAVMLAKHNICFNMNAVQKAESQVLLSEQGIQFYVDEKTIGFMNEARLVEQEVQSGSRACCIS